MNRQSRAVVHLVAGLALAGASGVACAGIDTVLIEHRSGPCADFRFPVSATNWNSLGLDGTGIPVAIDETVVVTLYGQGANQATDATGADILEWVDARGTNAQGKDYVRVALRAEARHGSGDRIVTIRWPSVATPTVATVHVTVVSTCEKLRGLGLRTAPRPRP